METVGKEIALVETNIEAAGKEIQDVTEKLNAIDLSVHDKQYLRQEKGQLRKGKDRLRQEKDRLRQKEDRFLEKELLLKEKSALPSVQHDVHVTALQPSGK